jgi:hypothetical protein
MTFSAVSRTGSASRPRSDLFGLPSVFFPSRSNQLVWQGQKKCLPSGAASTVQPRCGQVAVKALIAAPARTSHTCPSGCWRAVA